MDDIMKERFLRKSQYHSPRYIRDVKLDVFFLAK